MGTSGVLAIERSTKGMRPSHVTETRLWKCDGPRRYVSVMRVWPNLHASVFGDLLHSQLNCQYARTVRRTVSSDKPRPEALEEPGTTGTDEIRKNSVGARLVSALTPTLPHWERVGVREKSYTGNTPERTLPGDALHGF